MKNIALLILVALVTAFAGLGCHHADEAPKIAAKPYPLDVCAVCGMKLSDMKPCVFVYQDREIKVCDQDEEAEFKKDPAKYLKAIEAVEAKKTDGKKP